MRNRVWTVRGRPRGNHLPRSDTRALEYVAELSAKRGIDATELFNTFVDAWENGKATCQGLTIRSRTRKKGCVVFLITNEHLVVAQFPISETILRKRNPFEGFAFLPQPVRHVSEAKGRNALDTEPANIADLKAGMKSICLTARVTEISKPKLVLTRLNEYALFANATISDKTSTIKVPLWNERINNVSVNDRVQIEKASVTFFRGEKQLRIGRSGTIKVVESNPSNSPGPTMTCVAK